MSLSGTRRQEVIGRDRAISGIHELSNEAQRRRLLAAFDAMNGLPARPRPPGDSLTRDASRQPVLCQRVFHAGQVTPGVTPDASEIVTPDVTTANGGISMLSLMAERALGKTYIKEWREKRGHSLRKLASMMEWEPGEQLISHASLGRIEKGEQPYSQPILEALSIALNVSVSSLLEVNPEKEGEVVDLVRRLDEAKRAQAVDYLKFLAAK